MKEGATKQGTVDFDERETTDFRAKNADGPREDTPTATFEVQDHPPTMYLRVLDGQRAGTIYAIGSNGCSIGSCEDADLRLRESGVSRSHALILRDLQGTARIIDCYSHSGTFVAGRSISVEPLDDGAEILLGSSIRLSFHQDYASIERNGPLADVAPVAARAPARRLVNRPR